MSQPTHDPVGRAVEALRPFRPDSPEQAAGMLRFWIHRHTLTEEQVQQAAAAFPEPEEGTEHPSWCVRLDDEADEGSHISRRFKASMPTETVRIEVSASKPWDLVLPATIWLHITDEGESSDLPLSIGQCRALRYALRNALDLVR